MSPCSPRGSRTAARMGRKIPCWPELHTEHVRAGTYPSNPDDGRHLQSPPLHQVELRRFPLASIASLKGWLDARFMQSLFCTQRQRNP